jgi:hypothetical protein
MAFVQAVQAFATTSVTTLTTASITTTTGNSFVFGVTTGANAVTSVSDNKSNTWTPFSGNAITIVDPSGTSQQKVNLWTAPITSGGSGHTFTATTTAATTTAMIIAEFSGRNNANLVNAYAFGIDANTGTSHNLAGINNWPAGSDICTFIGDYYPSGTETQTATGGWTIPTNGSIINSSTWNAFLMYQASVSVGNYRVTATSGLSTAQYGAIVVALTAAGANTAKSPWVS